MDDNGEILGLESDYAGFGDIDRDKFELHLRNVLNNHFGVALVTTKLQVSFHLVADEEVCQIGITACAEPVLVKFPDKNGQLQERFYVRSGNSSQELSKSDMPGLYQRAHATQWRDFIGKSAWNTR